MGRPTIQAIWDGPYSWSGFEEENNLASIPDNAGVYLQTFDYQGGFLVYAAGITRRSVSTRFKEHTRFYLNGEYTVLDITAANYGKREEVWHGWGYAREHRDEFLVRKDEIQNAVRKQLSGFRIFVAKLPTEGRILERVEAALMNHLYTQQPPHCNIPDRGMMLAPRWAEESPMLMENVCASDIYALDQPIEI